MFWPIKDDNPTSHTPIVTWVLMLICVLVFIWQSQLTQTESQITILSYGIIPAHLFSFGNFSEINFSKRRSGRSMPILSVLYYWTCLMKIKHYKYLE
mgnify:CR=1 FL=1